MEEEKPKKKRKKAPIKREPSSSLEMAEREETRPKVKKAAEESEKAHKTPWQEKYASPEEIETFLNDHLYLRRNVVTLRTEWREPSSYESDGTENRCRGFYVVRRPDEERRTRARSLAYEAAKSDTQITDDTDTF